MPAMEAMPLQPIKEGEQASYGDRNMNPGQEKQDSTLETTIGFILIVVCDVGL
jgi:hypothetical protein